MATVLLKSLEHVLILLCLVYYVNHKKKLQKNKSPYSSFIPIFSLGLMFFLISPFDYLDYCLILLPNRCFFKLGLNDLNGIELRRVVNHTAPLENERKDKPTYPQDPCKLYLPTFG